MIRKATVGLYGLAGILAVGLTAASATGASAAPTRPSQSWCAQQGGTEVSYSPWYNTNGENPVRLGGQSTMCVFTNETNKTTILVAANALAADKPTMAALAYTLKPQKPHAPGSVNPAGNYCAQIGGVVQFGDKPGDVGGWAPSSAEKPTGFTAMCVFADQSMIDAWGLFYHTGGVIRGADLAGKWKATLPQG